MFKVDKLEKMVRGWFVGNFSPSVFKTNDVEVGVKKYKKGEYEDSHFHKVATEITLILDGKVLMNNKEYVSGDIITIEPNVATDFKALTDVTTVVVKHPGANDDKYITRE
jgi:quercetin dioxygenase-like cupin family protein